MDSRCCTKCNRYGDKWYLFCPHCGGEMAERCKECGLFEPINKKFCLTQANEVSQDLHIFIRKRLANYDKIFWFILIFGSLAIEMKYFDASNANKVAAIINVFPYILILLVPLVIIHHAVCRARRKKVIEKFKVAYPKYQAILEKMGI